MKILIYVQTLAHGGAERVASEIANGLSKLGHNVYVLTSTKVPVQYALDKHVKILEAPQNKVLGKWYNRFCIIRARKYLKELSPDVAIGIMWSEALTLYLASKMIRKPIPIVFSDHDSFEKPFKLSLRRRFVKNVLSKWVDCYTVLTKADYSCAKASGIKTVETMYNPLSIEPLDSFPTKSPIVLAVGRLDDWYYKGFDLLIKAWGAISEKHPEWKLIIAGRGNEKNVDYLNNLIKEYCLIDNISLIGHHNDMVSVYRDSAVFVLSSRYEGFGLVLTEAMSQHCACIACDYKGRQSEIITDGVDGIICEPDNVEKLSEKLDLLLSNHALRLSLQQNSSKNLGKFSPEQVSQNWEKLLMDILQSKK